MYRAFIGIFMMAGILAPLRAGADVLTTKIGDREVTYVATAAPRGVGLSKQEILEQLDKSAPVTPMSPIYPKQH
jgi:hypothetical protein